MNFCKLFSVPEGKRITDKCLYRVLVASICSILLCMGSLAATTWAWFAVSIENTENVIAVASNPEVVITVNDEEIDSGSTLDSDITALLVEHAGDWDDIQQKSTLYVTFLLNEEVQGYVILNCENDYRETIHIATNQESVLSWAISWFEPHGADLVVGNLIELIIEEEELLEEESAEAESAVGESDPAKGSTEPAKGSTESVGEEADSTEETTQPTGPVTEPDVDNSKPTESTTEPAEETTQPTGSETGSTTETTEPVGTEMGAEENGSQTAENGDDSSEMAVNTETEGNSTDIDA